MRKFCVKFFQRNSLFGSFGWFIALFITKLEMTENHTGTIDPALKIGDVIFPEISKDTSFGVYVFMGH